MTNSRLVFISYLIVLFSLTTFTNGINQDSNDETSSKVDQKEWTDKNFLLTTGSIIGLACVLSFVMIYTVIKFRHNSFFSKDQNECSEDKEKGIVQNALDELFQSTANDEDLVKDNLKRKSVPNENDQNTSKVHGFLMRAMTLQQNFYGKIQTIQITEQSTNIEQPTKKIKTANQQQVASSSSSNSPTGNLINTSNQVERPVNFKKQQSKAVKSPSSNYLKKSPSPTGAPKSPPQQSNESIVDKQEIDLIKRDDVASTSKEEIISNTDDNSVKLKLDSDNDSLGEFKLGKIQFCLKYNYEKHAITVSMIKCMNLPGKNTMNTYVKLQLLPDKKHKVKTRTIRKNQNPSYQEDFTFFNIQPAQLENLALHFMVMSFDRYSRDEVLGEVLHSCSDQFDSLEKQVCICLDIAPKGLLSKALGRGEILLSLSYHPASFLLSLVVLKAKNLRGSKQQNITGLPDPYVKINLYINNKRISKKKTHSKKRTLNPIYNQVFSFDLSEYLSKEMPAESNDDYVDLMAWKNIKLELIVIDYDRIARNENIGCLTMSIDDEDATVRKHMKDMLTCPRKQVAGWHRLKDV